MMQCDFVVGFYVKYFIRTEFYASYVRQQHNNIIPPKMKYQKPQKANDFNKSHVSEQLLLREKTVHNYIFLTLIIVIIMLTDVAFGSTAHCIFKFKFHLIPEFTFHLKFWFLISENLNLKSCLQN